MLFGGIFDGMTPERVFGYHQNLIRYNADKELPYLRCSSEQGFTEIDLKAGAAGWLAFEQVGDTFYGFELVAKG